MVLWLREKPLQKPCVVNLQVVRAEKNIISSSAIREAREQCGQHMLHNRKTPGPPDVL